MPLENDREYWLERAEDMRAKAGVMSKQCDAQGLVGVIETYTHLADQVTGSADVLAELSKHRGEQGDNSDKSMLKG
jgi:hypothetical protein